MIYGFIYVIENFRNGKLYVGQSVNPDQRHAYQLSKYTHCTALRNAVAKYGYRNFDFCLIEACYSREELNKREAHWIKELDTISPSGYNLTSGGESPNMTKEVRLKISKSRRGSRNPMFGKSGEKSPTFGRRHTPEALQKISRTHKGKVISPEIRKKMQQSHAGIHKGEDNPFFGKKHSEESRRKMSEKGRGRKFSLEHREKIRQVALRRWQKRKANE